MKSSLSISRKILRALCAVIWIVPVPAIAQSPSTQPDIVSHINSSGTCQIIASDTIMQLLMPVDEETAAKRAEVGKKQLWYRVQVFSDSRGETSKKEAQARERAVKRRFPNLVTTVGYETPRWTLRVGRYRTPAEAQEIMAQLKRAFPAYAREMSITREAARVTN